MGVCLSLDLGKYLSNPNPATGEELSKVPDSNAADVDKVRPSFFVFLMFQTIVSLLELALITYTCTPFSIPRQ